MLKKSSNRGFTLIELLVVIAIIAILAAILFPVFAQAREKARQSSCLANTKQMGNALIMYSQDYDEGLPAWDSGPACSTGKTPGNVISMTSPCPANFDRRTYWDAVLLPYVKNGTPPSATVGSTGGIWTCPSATNRNQPSYGYSMHLAYTWPSTPAFYRWPKGQEIAEPAATVFVGDGGSSGRLGRTIDYQSYAERKRCSGLGPEPTREHSFRHNDGANYVFCDGHASWKKWEIMYPPTDNDSCTIAAGRRAYKACADWFGMTQADRDFCRARQ